MSSMGTPTVKLNRSREGSASPRVETQTVSPGVDIVLEALHRTAGNHAVGRLLDVFNGKPASEAGHPLDEAMKNEMEARFGEDFGNVRLHTGGTAAATASNAGAEAFTMGTDITFGRKGYRPDSSAGRTLLAHELAHVVQQRRGGDAPAFGENATHEQDAQSAADAYAAGAGPINVSASTGVGMACSVDDWLIGHVDLSTWGYTDLDNERKELLEWHGRQSAGDEKTDRIWEAIGLIEAQMAVLNKGIAGPSRKRSRKAGGKQKTKKDAENAGPGVPDMPPPRCLVEQKTTQFEDPKEAREEFDRIVAWLQRKDVLDDDRQILQLQLHHLAPEVGLHQQQRATERRRAVVGRALTPSGGGDARARIREAVRMVDSIKPVSGRDGEYYLMHGKEMIVLTAEEALQIRASTVAALSAAADKIKAIDQDASNRLEAQGTVDRENLFAAWGVSLFTDKDTWDALDQFDRISSQTLSARGRFLAAKRSDNLPAMAEELANAEESALRSKALVDAHLGDIQTTGENVITGLQITSAAAFTIVMIGTAGAAAPAVGSFVAGAGITGAGGTALTVAGTSALIGAEGFLLHGGSAAGGELAAGHSWSDAADAGWREGKKGFETGVKIGAGAAAAPIAAARFGVGTPGVGAVGNVVRSGAAAGTTNLGVEAGTRALLHQELLSGKEAGLAFGGGLIGGSAGRVTQKIGNSNLRGATNVAVGATSSGALTYAATGDTDQALQSAALGGATALGAAKSPQPSGKGNDRAFAAGQKTRSAAKSANRKATRTLAAGMFGLQTSGAVPAVSSGDRSNTSSRTVAASVTAASAGSPPAAQQPDKASAVQASKPAASTQAVPRAVSKAPAEASTPATAKSAQQTPSAAAAKTPARKSASQKKAQQAAPSTKAAKQPAPVGAKRSRKPKVDVSKQGLDERIAAAELELQAARKKTGEYFEKRKQAGRSRKGGPKKGIDNAKEKLWFLKRQKAYPDRQILYSCEVKGVRLPDGTLTSAKSVAGSGRDPDFVEISPTKTTMGELKSEWEFNKSLVGGPGTRQGGQTTVATGSKMGGQFAAEDKVVAHARGVQGKVVVTGFDLRTGRRIEIELDPDQMRRAIFSSTAGFGIGSEYSN